MKIDSDDWRCPSKLLWAFARATTLAHGGDGCTLIVSPDWRTLADKFARYEDEEGEPWFVRQTDVEDSAVFLSGQECVVFQSEPGTVAGYECVIIVNTDMDEAGA